MEQLPGEPKPTIIIAVKEFFGRIYIAKHVQGGAVSPLPSVCSNCGYVALDCKKKKKKRASQARALARVRKPRPFICGQV